MTARHLEANGIATVVIGSAWDILERCGTPRVVYNDLPLGNPLGKPGDENMQLETMMFALNLLKSASHPGEVVSTPFTWSDNDDWKIAYMRLDDKDPSELIQLGDENRRQRRLNREKGLVR